MAKNKEKSDPYKELGKADAAPADPAPQPARDITEFKGGESAWGYDPAARAEQAVESREEVYKDQPPPIPPSTAEAEALTTGREVERQYRPDADPLHVECLELLQRLHAGGLILPTAYSAFEGTRALIAKLKEKTAPEGEEKEK